MKQRKQSVIGDLARFVQVALASELMQIPAHDLMHYFGKDRSVSMRCLLKRICRSNECYHLPVIGEPAYTLKGVMSHTGMGLYNVRFWCVGTHYVFSKSDIDTAWNKAYVHRQRTRLRSLHQGSILRKWWLSLRSK